MPFLKFISYLILANILSSCSFLSLETSQTETSQTQTSKSDAGHEATPEQPLTAIKKEQTPAPQTPLAIYPTKTAPNSKKVQAYCQTLDEHFKRYQWGESRCDDYTWHHVRNSHLGNPIIWYVFGDEQKRKKQKMNISLVMCGVHGDEITPVKFCFDLLHDLKHNPAIIDQDSLIVIAPLVAPDSFLKPKPTRTNARGVDVNRNFPTQDWGHKAIHLWKNRYGSDERRYPGKYALSEQETIFQVNLINLYRPNKIISVHAPLTLLDYDGPAFSHEQGQVAKRLLEDMSHKAGRYKISDYPFFTGSLGNWAGNEKSIPTYTLELPNSDWHKTDQYYDMFQSAIHFALQHKMQLPLDKQEDSKSSIKRQHKKISDSHTEKSEQG